MQGAEIYVPEGTDLRDVYRTPQFEREVTLPDRTEAMCDHLAGLLHRSGPMEKTMVFCVDMDHARLVAENLQNAFGHLGYDNYAVPIISEEGEESRRALEQFQDSDKKVPVVATTAELLPFIHGRLIPYLAGLPGSPVRDTIASIFAERNVIVCASPYNLRDVLDIVDGINFHNQDDIHTVSHVYEDLLKKLGNENKMAGEFYTPRPVIKFIVDVINELFNLSVTSIVPVPALSYAISL